MRPLLTQHEGNLWPLVKIRRDSIDQSELRATFKHLVTFDLPGLLGKLTDEM